MSQKCFFLSFKCLFLQLFFIKNVPVMCARHKRTKLVVTNPQCRTNNATCWSCSNPNINILICFWKKFLLSVPPNFFCSISWAVTMPVIKRPLLLRFTRVLWSPAKVGLYLTHMLAHLSQHSYFWKYTGYINN